MGREDTQRQGTVDTTRDSPKQRDPARQQGSGQRQQQQQPGRSVTPGGGEPQVQENSRDRESSTGTPRQSGGDVERGGSGGDLPM